MSKETDKWEDLPRWKRGPLSVFRDAGGAFSSKRVAGFAAITAAAYATYLQADPMIIAIWLAFAAGLWGFSLGESGAPTMTLTRRQDFSQSVAASAETRDETSERITREIGNDQ